MYCTGRRYTGLQKSPVQYQYPKLGHTVLQEGTFMADFIWEVLKNDDFKMEAEVGGGHTRTSIGVKTRAGSVEPMVKSTGRLIKPVLHSF